MLKHINLLVYFIVIINSLSASVDIECEFKADYFYKFGNPYFCKALNIPNITTYESAQITSINGAHFDQKTNNDVKGFYSAYKVIQYFPRGLEKLFKNLEFIFIEYAGLKEIHQADLKPFPKLVYLSLMYNSIQVLESGVFDANPNLEILAFVANDLVHIDPNVFDNLPKLGCFWFSRTCVEHFVFSREETIAAIEDVRKKCVDADYQFMNEKIKKFETESKFLNPEQFTENFEAFEKSFVKSKFYNFSTLRNRFEGLRNFTVDLSSKHQCRKLSSFEILNSYDFESLNSSIDMKILHLSESMKELTTEGLGLNDKLVKLDGKFSKFESKVSKKLSKIDKEVESIKNKMEAKLKKIEKSFLDNVGKILEDKLREILDEKLNGLLNTEIKE